MWRMIRAALLGIIIGVIGGTIIGQISYTGFLYRLAKKQSEEVMGTLNSGNISETDMAGADMSEEAIYALMYNDSQMLYGNTDEYVQLLDAMLASDEDAYEIGDDETGMEEDNLVPEVIRFQVIYNGNEDLSDDEIGNLQTFVKQGVLYALAMKLGEDYNQKMSREEVRRALIMGLELINQTAEESALEWGVAVKSQAYFYFQYMPECEIQGVYYPAGYYEVLNIELTE